MPGEVSRSYDGPKDGSPLLPEWICPRCERDKSKCICRASEAAELAATVRPVGPTNSRYMQCLCQWRFDLHGVPRNVGLSENCPVHRHCT